MIHIGDTYTLILFDSIILVILFNSEDSTVIFQFLFSSSRLSFIIFPLLFFPFLFLVSRLNPDCSSLSLSLSLSLSQAHLLSLFDNVNRVVFNEKIYDQILSFQSQEGETVELSTPVLAQVHTPVALALKFSPVFVYIYR